MKLDVIGYRYSTEELAVLMSLLGRDKICAVPGIRQPDREQFIHGMSMLEDNDILSNAGGQLLLDRLHSFLISSLCDCDRYFTIEKEKHFLALCICAKIVMFVLTRDREHWVVRVAPDLEGIMEEYELEKKRFRGSCMIRMADGRSETEREAPNPEVLGDMRREWEEALKKDCCLFE